MPKRSACNIKSYVANKPASCTFSKTPDSKITVKVRLREKQIMAGRK